MCHPWGRTQWQTSASLTSGGCRKWGENEGTVAFEALLDTDCWLAAQWNPAHLSPNFGLREAPGLGLEGGRFADMLFFLIHRTESCVTNPMGQLTS